MQNYVLVGPLAGRTITLGGHQFVEGVFKFGPTDDVMPSDQDKALKAKLLAKMYQAFPEGSAELEAAQRRFKEGKAPDNELDVAKREDEDQAQRKPAGASGSDRSIKGAVRTALTKLDAKNDEHWTEGGLPSVAAVRELSSNDKVSRADITELAPNLTREEAAKVQGGGDDPLDERAE